MVTRSRHDRQVEVTPREQQELTATWYSTFETARKGQTLGRGGSGGRYFGVVGGGAAVLILLTTVVLVAPVLVSTALGRTMWIIVMPNLTDTVERFRLVEVGRRYRLEGSTVSPLEAGTAAWRLSNVGEDAQRLSNFGEDASDQPWVRPPADPISAPWLPDGDADPFDAEWREIDFFEAARNGFSDGAARGDPNRGDPSRLRGLADGSASPGCGPVGAGPGPAAPRRRQHVRPPGSPIPQLAGGGAWSTGGGGAVRRGRGLGGGGHPRPRGDLRRRHAGRQLDLAHLRAGRESPGGDGAGGAGLTVSDGGP